MNQHIGFRPSPPNQHIRFPSSSSSSSLPHTGTPSPHPSLFRESPVQSPPHAATPSSSAHASPIHSSPVQATPTQQPPAQTATVQGESSLINFQTTMFSQLPLFVNLTQSLSDCLFNVESDLFDIKKIVSLSDDTDEVPDTPISPPHNDQPPPDDRPPHQGTPGFFITDLPPPPLFQPSPPPHPPPSPPQSTPPQSPPRADETANDDVHKEENVEISKGGSST